METVSYREKKLRETKLKHIIIILSGSVATLAGPEREIDSTVSIILYIISITIVQSYTGKYHELVAVCTVTSAQHE